MSLLCCICTDYQVHSPRPLQMQRQVEGVLPVNRGLLLLVSHASRYRFTLHNNSNMKVGAVVRDFVVWHVCRQ